MAGLTTASAQRVVTIEEAKLYLGMGSYLGNVKRNKHQTKTTFVNQWSEGVIDRIKISAGEAITNAALLKAKFFISRRSEIAMQCFEVYCKAAEIDFEADDLDPYLKTIQMKAEKIVEFSSKLNFLFNSLKFTENCQVFLPFVLDAGYYLSKINLPLVNSPYHNELFESIPLVFDLKEQKECNWFTSSNPDNKPIPSEGIKLVFNMNRNEGCNRGEFKIQRSDNRIEFTVVIYCPDPKTLGEAFKTVNIKWKETFDHNAVILHPQNLENFEDLVHYFFNHLNISNTENFPNGRNNLRSAIIELFAFGRKLKAETPSA